MASQQEGYTAARNNITQSSIKKRGSQKQHKHNNNNDGGYAIFIFQQLDENGRGRHVYNIALYHFR